MENYHDKTISYRNDEIISFSAMFDDNNNDSFEVCIHLHG